MPSRSRDTICPSFAISLSLSLERGRRESRAPTAPAVPCAKVVKESTRVELQVQPRHPGFPRAMVLRLIRALPGEAAFLVPVVREETPAGSARVAAPGPHDFAVRCERSRPVVLFGRDPYRKTGFHFSGITPPT